MTTSAAEISSTNGAVISICNAALESSTCNGDTGRDLTIHRLCPSRETEGAAESFIQARALVPHAAATAMTPGIISSSVTAMVTRSLRLISRNTNATAMKHVPRPQLMM